MRKARRFTCQPYEDLLRTYLRRFPAENKKVNGLARDLLALGNRQGVRSHLTASALVLDRSGQYLLLIHRPRLGGWLQPGGHIESGEAPWEAARRETAEETGLRRLQLHSWHDSSRCPIDIDTHYVKEGAENRRRKHHDFRYLFRSKRTVTSTAPHSVPLFHRWMCLRDLEEEEIVASLKKALRKLGALGLTR